MSGADRSDGPTLDWRVVAVAVGAGIVTALQVGKVPPSLPVLRADLGLSLIAAGWVQSLFNACGAMLGVAAGTMADRIGPRRVMLACLVLLALGSLIGAVAPAGAPLLFGRFVEGIGFVGLVVAAPAIIVAAADPRRRRLALGIWGIYMPTGMALAMMVAPAILAAHGWRGLWLANAALLLLFSLIAAAAFAATRETAERGRSRVYGPSDLRRTLRQPGPWLYGLCFGLYALQFFAVMTWLPTFLVEAQNRSLREAAIWAAIVVAANILGNLASAWLMHRGVAIWRLIAIAFAMMALTGIGIFSALGPDAMKVSLALAFSAFGGLLPAAVLAGAPAHATSPAEVATASGFAVQGSNLGSLSGPPVMAALVSVSGGWQHSHWLLVACGCIGLILAFRLRALERRRE